MKTFLMVLMMATIASMTQAQQKNEEKELATLIEKLRVAMVEADKKALEEIAAEELSYGHSGGHVEGKAEFVEKIVSGKSDFVSIELSNQTIAIVDNNAIVRHNLAAVTLDNGIQGSVSLHVLSVWQKQKGKWKMIARQAVKVPVK
jgi:hypothetical protein